MSYASWRINLYIIRRQIIVFGPGIILIEGPDLLGQPMQLFFVRCCELLFVLCNRLVQIPDQ
ncbi:hypothetical protein D3C85_1783970 [compost metagenome]